jgi:hypothetical protein
MTAKTQAHIASANANESKRALSHCKSILVKEVTQDPDVKYSPHAEEKLTVLKSIAGV